MASSLADEEAVGCGCGPPPAQLCGEEWRRRTFDGGGARGRVGMCVRPQNSLHVACSLSLLALVHARREVDLAPITHDIANRRLPSPDPRSTVVNKSDKEENKHEMAFLGICVPSTRKRKSARTYPGNLVADNALYNGWTMDTITQWTQWAESVMANLMKTT